MKTIGKLLGIVGLIAGLILPVQADNYEVDIKESTLKWTGKKVAGTHYGTITFEKGNFQVINNKITDGSFNVNMLSIVCTDLENETWNKKLVDHLKSDDFFSTEEYPVSSLTLKGSEHSNGNTYLFDAELTIKGITHPLSFEADVEMNNATITVSGTLKIDRTLYDIKYGSGKFFKSLGDNMIDDFFTLDFNLVANKSGQVTSVTK